MPSLEVGTGSCGISLLTLDVALVPRFECLDGRRRWFLPLRLSPGCAVGRPPYGQQRYGQQQEGRIKDDDEARGRYIECSRHSFPDV